MAKFTTVKLNSGPHPVPEDAARGRYTRNTRNGPLIRQAVLMADQDFVFDNSIDGSPPRLILNFERGKLLRAAADLPDWATKIYVDITR